MISNYMLKTFSLLPMKFSQLSPIFCICFARNNSTVAQFGKLNRRVYTRRYPLRMVNADGSCFDIMYSAPQSIFHVPFDTSHMTLQQLQKYKLERKSKSSRKQKTKKKESVNDEAIDFDHSSFNKFL